MLIGGLTAGASIFYVTLKQAVIQWILEKDRADYYQGIAYLRKIDPDHFLIGKPESTSTRLQLLQVLGSALRSDKINTKKSAVKITKEPDKVDTKIDSREKPGTPSDELSPAAKLSFEINDLVKNRAWLHNKINKATSDKERKGLMKEAGQIQDKIVYNRKLIRRIESGEQVELPDPDVSEDDESDNVPGGLYELDLKIRRLRTRRSKAKRQLDELKEKGNEGSPKYQQLARRWEGFDTTIRQLEAIKKIRTEGGKES
jgi:predicted  nucleic acid-binding Zn-ribbon protein